MKKIVHVASHISVTYVETVVDYFVGFLAGLILFSVIIGFTKFFNILFIHDL